MRLKKVMGMSMALLMGVSTVAGCGSKGVSMPEEPADIAKLATERTNALKSYELNGTGNFDMEMMGQEVKVEMDMHAVYFKDPMKMKMDYNISYEGEKMDYSIYLMKEEDNYVTYTCMDDTWSKQTLDPEDEAQKKMIEQMESSVFNMGEDYYQNYTISEEQPNEGEKALDFTMKTDDLVDLMGKMGFGNSSAIANGSMASALTDGETLKEMFGEDGEIKSVMSVDTENVYWKSAKIDMTSMMQGMLDYVVEMASSLSGSEEEMTAKASNCVMEMTYDKYDAAEDFTLPEEAKNAEELDTSSLLGGAEDDASVSLDDETATEETEEQ